MNRRLVATSSQTVVAFSIIDGEGKTRILMPLDEQIIVYLDKAASLNWQPLYNYYSSIAKTYTKGKYIGNAQLAFASSNEYVLEDYIYNTFIQNKWKLPSWLKLIRSAKKDIVYSRVHHSFRIIVYSEDIDNNKPVIYKATYIGVQFSEKMRSVQKDKITYQIYKFLYLSPSQREIVDNYKTINEFLNEKFGADIVYSPSEALSKMQFKVINDKIYYSDQTNTNNSTEEKDNNLSTQSVTHEGNIGNNTYMINTAPPIIQIPSITSSNILTSLFSYLQNRDSIIEYEISELSPSLMNGVFNYNLKNITLYNGKLPIGLYYIQGKPLIPSTHEWTVTFSNKNNELINAFSLIDEDNNAYDLTTLTYGDKRQNVLDNIPILLKNIGSSKYSISVGGYPYFKDVLGIKIGAEETNYIKVDLVGEVMLDYNDSDSITISYDSNTEKLMLFWELPDDIESLNDLFLLEIKYNDTSGILNINSRLFLQPESTASYSGQTKVHVYKYATNQYPTNYQYETLTGISLISYTWDLFTNAKLKSNYFKENINMAFAIPDNDVKIFANKYNDTYNIIKENTNLIMIENK